MANEENQQPTPPPTPFTEETAPEPVKETQDQTIREMRDVPVETVPTEQLPEIAKGLKQGETDEERAHRRAAEARLNKPIEAIEDRLNALDKQDQAIAANIGHVMPHAMLSNSTTLYGYTIPLPIYTVVYVTLATLTILEVIIASLPRGFLGTAILIGFSGVKAALVVAFYMHLREDSRLFVLVLVPPMVLVLVASVFLLSVPAHGY